MHDDSPSNIVSLPFLAATRAASAPALGRFGALYGGSQPMQDVYRRIDKVAPTSATVLIIGESGSGKEVVARTIHDRSERARAPFVAVNCGAIPGNLIEAELFGYEKGAFTGAARMHRGCFERAEGGTLFLDEVTEMAPEMQVRLLRVLETGRFTRVGGEEELRARVRIIAATNRDPRQAVADGHLREDLMYRLAVFPIALPPLREREGDAELLAEHFLAELNDAEGTTQGSSRGRRSRPSARIAGRATCASSRTPCSARSSWPTTRSSSTSRGSTARRRSATACASRSARRSRKSSARRSTPRSTCAKATSGAAPRCSA